MKLAIEPCPALLVNITPQTRLNLEVAPRTEPIRRKFAGALSHAMGNVFTSDNQVLTRLVLAAQDHVGVRIVNVPVVDRDPLQARSEIALYPLHELAGEVAQVREMEAVFGCDELPRVI